MGTKTMPVSIRNKYSMTTFWELFRKLSLGKLDKLTDKLIFDKNVADEYYPMMYSTVLRFDSAAFNWFAYVDVTLSHVVFNLSPVKLNILH